MDNNVYILRCRRTGDAMLIDAANEHEALLEICRRLGVRPGGRDPRALGPHPGRAGGARRRHLGGRDQRRRRHAAQLRPHPRGRRAARGGRPAHPDPGHARATPRAPSASPSRARNLLFTGDTLFPGGPGNTSFEGGDFATIIQSIERRIFAAFGPDTLVLPGHGASTTVGNESPTCRNGSTGAGEGRRGESAGIVAAAATGKPDQNGKLLDDDRPPPAARDPGPPRLAPRTAPSCAAST